MNLISFFVKEEKDQSFFPSLQNKKDWITRGVVSSKCSIVRNAATACVANMVIIFLRQRIDRYKKGRKERERKIN